MLLPIIMLVGVGYATQRKKYEELHEAWEQEYGPLGLSYKDLYLATKRFQGLSGSRCRRFWEGFWRHADFQWNPSSCKENIP